MGARQLSVVFVGGFVVVIPVLIFPFNGRRHSRRHCSSRHRRMRICTHMSTVWDRRMGSSGVLLVRVVSLPVVCIFSQGIGKVGYTEGQCHLQCFGLCVAPPQWTPCVAFLSPALVGLPSALLLVVLAS